MPGGPRLTFRSVCRACNHPRPMTFDGWCTTCAQLACAEGDGERVGLPVPDDPLRALQQMVIHLVSGVYRPGECWPCALLTMWCGDCDTPTPEMSAAEVTRHVLVGPWVARGCEGFVPAAIRTAGIIGAPSR